MFAFDNGEIDHFSSSRLTTAGFAPHGIISPTYSFVIFAQSASCFHFLSNPGAIQGVVVVQYAGRSVALRISRMNIFDLSIRNASPMQQSSTDALFLDQCCVNWTRLTVVMLSAPQQMRRWSRLRGMECYFTSPFTCVKQAQRDRGASGRNMTQFPLLCLQGWGLAVGEELRVGSC